MSLLDTLPIPFAAFSVTVVLHVVALRMFHRWKLLDFPERYGLRRARIPYPTGIIAVLTFLVLFWIFFARDIQDLGLMAAVAMLAVFSFRDDRTPLSPFARLAVQAAAALILFLAGTRIFSLTNPLEGVLGGPVIPLDILVIPSPLFSDPSALGALFTVVWILLTINALNWFDGIPGQVSLLSVIAFLTIGLLAVLRGDATDPAQQELSLISFLLAGIALGGLFFDFPPAKVLMGDTGAMFFGLLLGTLTIYAGGKVATAFLVLGVPLLDSMIVAVRRLARGQSALRGGRDHLHHLLLARGWSSRQIILLTALLGTAFGVTALFLSTTGKLGAGIILAVVMVALHIYAGRNRREIAGA